MENFIQNLNNGNLGGMALLASFLSGIISSITPCTLGILPLIIAYSGVDEEKDTKKTTLKIICLIAGLAAVMTIFGILSALAGKIFMLNGGKYWTLFAGSLLIVFGLNILEIIDIDYGNFIKKMPKKFGNKYIFAFIIGCLFALSSTPCATPFLAGILTYASITKKIPLSALMLFLFALGQGVILVLASIFTTFIKKIQKLDKLFNFIMKIAGVLLIISGVLFWWEVFAL